MEAGKPKEVTGKMDEELEKEEDKVRANQPSYVWATKPTIRDMVTLTEDLAELSVYAAGEMVLKSHVYSALGACLYEGKPMVVWVDYPLEIVKKYARKLETRRTYWNTSLKTRGYNCLEMDGDIFGLSPSCQEFRVKDDKYLSEFGLKLKQKVFPFQGEDWKKEIRYLELDVNQVTQEPTTTKIKKWLEMDRDEDMIAEEMMDELTKRQEEMN